MYDSFSADYDRFVDWPTRLAAELPLTVWWACMAFFVAVVLFMLYFVAKVRQKGVRYAPNRLSLHY